MNRISYPTAQLAQGKSDSPKTDWAWEEICPWILTVVSQGQIWCSLECKTEPEEEPKLERFVSAQWLKCCIVANFGVRIFANFFSEGCEGQNLHTWNISSRLPFSLSCKKWPVVNHSWLMNYDNKKNDCHTKTQWKVEEMVDKHQNDPIILFSFLGLHGFITVADPAETLPQPGQCFLPLALAFCPPVLPMSLCHTMPCSKEQHDTEL